MFLHVQNIQTLRVDDLYIFSNIFFFYQMCTIPFEIDENCFYNPFEHIWLKNVFDFENYGIENVTLIKVVHIYVRKGMNA